MNSQIPLEDQHDEAYAAFDVPDLPRAAELFGALVERCPRAAHYHYMLGLAHKYLRQWHQSLSANQRAIEVADEASEGAIWNAGIAATGIGNWAEARILWAKVGMKLPQGNNAPDGDFGPAVVRLNPWGDGETVWVRRIDPVRARIENVPFPESGHRYGDVVLHDGASTGMRQDQYGHDRHVFNELQRLQPSEFQTYVAFVSCPRREDLQPIYAAIGDELAMVEDWTESVRVLCLRCSYGVVHRHEAASDDSWKVERNLGVAARSRDVVTETLRAWVKGGKGRRVESIESGDAEVPEFDAGHPWWEGKAPDDEE